MAYNDSASVEKGSFILFSVWATIRVYIMAYNDSASVEKGSFILFSVWTTDLLSDVTYDP